MVLAQSVLTPFACTCRGIHRHPSICWTGNPSVSGAGISSAKAAHLLKFMIGATSINVNIRNLKIFGCFGTVHETNFSGSLYRQRGAVAEYDRFACSWMQLAILLLYALPYIWISSQFSTSLRTMSRSGSLNTS